MTIKIGETIPYCEIPATSQLTFSPKAYQGKKLVLYFYPKDSTPGCTVEAGEFRDHIDSFNQANALVVGVIEKIGVALNQKINNEVTV